MERKYYFRGLGLGIAVTAIIMGVATSNGREMTDQEIIARAKELGMVENTVLADMNEKEEEAEKTEAANESGAEGDHGGVTDGQQTADGGTNTEKQEQGEAETIDQVQNAGGEAQAKDKASDDDGETEAGQVNGGESVPDGTEPGQDDGDRATEEDGAEEADGMNRPTDREEEPDLPDSENEKTAEGGSITVSRGDGSHTVAKKLADAGIVSSADSFDQFLCQNGYDKKLRTGTFRIPAGADDVEIARIITGVE